MTLKLAFADGLPFGAPHRGLEYQQFRAPAYKRADIGMSYLLVGNPESQQKVQSSKFKVQSSKFKVQSSKFKVQRIWLGIDGLNIFGISNVNSYYWVTDVTNHQYAVPNYLTGRQINNIIITKNNRWYENFSH